MWESAFKDNSFKEYIGRDRATNGTGFKVIRHLNRMKRKLTQGIVYPGINRQPLYPKKEIVSRSRNNRDSILPFLCVFLPIIWKIKEIWNIGLFKTDKLLYFRLTNNEKREISEILV